MVWGAPSQIDKFLAGAVSNPNAYIARAFAFTRVVFRPILASVPSSVFPTIVRSTFVGSHRAGAAIPDIIGTESCESVSWKSGYDTSEVANGKSKRQIEGKGICAVGTVGGY